MGASAVEKLDADQSLVSLQATTVEKPDADQTLVSLQATAVEKFDAHQTLVSLQATAVEKSDAHQTFLPCFPGSVRRIVPEGANQEFRSRTRHGLEAHAA
jgi:hypothetical protein